MLLATEPYINNGEFCTAWDSDASGVAAGESVMICQTVENLTRVKDALVAARGALHPVRGLARETDVIILEHYADIELTHTKISQGIQHHLATCDTCKTR